MSDTVQVENYWGEKVSILADQIKSFESARMIVHIPLGDGFVTTFQRQTSDLERFPAEPREFVVCFHRPHEGTTAAFSDLSFHEYLGGPGGALNRMGEMIHNYTDGQY